MRRGAVLSARSCNRYNAWGGAGGISLQDEHDGHVASCLPLLCVVPASSVYGFRLYTMVMSAHVDQTCEDVSQSQRNPTT